MRVFFTVEVKFPLNYKSNFYRSRHYLKVVNVNTISRSELGQSNNFGNRDLLIGNATVPKNIKCFLPEKEKEKPIKIEKKVL